MTRLEMQQAIERRLGQRTGLADTIVKELQLAQRHFERKGFLPWFLRYNAVVAVSAAYYTPSNFLREVEDEPFFRRVPASGSDIPLVKESYSYLESIEDLSGTGAPTHYALVSTGGTTSLYLFPIPDVSYDFMVTYFAAATTMSADGTENVWGLNAPELLIARAGLQVAKALRSVEAVQVFASDLVEAKADYYSDDRARDMNAREMTMGG